MKFTFQPESRPLAGYTLKRGIARGGFGEVYYALSDAGKEVAVKLLQHNLDVELRGVQQCLNLRHPHLVTIFDVKTDADNDHWVVMEYIGGQTLEQVLQSHPGPLPLDQVEKWLVGLAGGLAYLHDRGIVHRDVKPGNVFWDQGAVKLGDIGLSKFMTPSRRSAHTESVGTVYYMAPEVTYGKYGYEVDVYSTGVMLYEMLTGKLPFDGQSTGEILMKHLSEPPDLNIVPPAFRPMLISALEKDPKKRTGSMGQLLEDFQQARRGGPVRTAETRPSGFAKWIPPSNLPEPGPIGQPALAGAIPAHPSIPLAGPGRRTTGHDHVSSVAWWQRFAVIAGCLAGPALIYRLCSDGPVRNPLTLLLYWPLAFTAARTIPLIRTPAGTYVTWSLQPLVRYLERDLGAGKLLQTLKSWTRTPASYWTVWTVVYLLIQINLNTLLAGFTASGFSTFSMILMYGVFAIPLYLARQNADQATNDDVVENCFVPAGAGPARAANGWQAASPPLPQHVAREQRRPPVPLATPVTMSQRLADLSGSLNWATLLTLVFGLGTGFLSPLFGTPTSLHPDLGKLGLFVLTSLVGVWAVLISSKLTAGSTGFGRHKRLIGMVTGAAVGSAAWWLSQILLVDVAINLNMEATTMFNALGRQPLAMEGKPTWLAYSVFFGALFGVRRWWWHADPLRPALFRISSVLLTVAIAAVLPKVFLFPWDWGVTWAAVMSCVVQLSAAWVPPELRVHRT